MRDIEGSQDDPRREKLPPSIQMLGLSSDLRPFWVADIQDQRDCSTASTDKPSSYMRFWS
jgi:hypothetical protein